MFVDSASSLNERRIELYQTLAEALAGSPSWMSLPGEAWPLTQASADLAPHSDAAKTALNSLANIPPEPEAYRHARYKRFFGGPGHPRFSLYESMWRTGRFLGPETIALEQLYRSMGLEVIGAEAPDHASVELAFLAHLTERQILEPALASKWKQLELLFIKKHTGQWLVALGRSLVASGDEVYGPIGELLAGWMLEAQRPPRRQRRPNGYHHQPVINHEELCSLCGFCVQVCPTGVLKIQETNDETFLRATSSACNGCRKCESTCPAGVLKIKTFDNKQAILDGPVVFRRSPRVRCPGCGQATVSQAEFDFVARQVGPQDWLPYCLPCRLELQELTQ